MRRIFKNGDVADGPSGAAVAQMWYGLKLRRGQVYYSRAAPLGTNFASGVTHRARFYTNSDELWCRVGYSDSGVAGNAGFSTLTIGGTSYLSSFQDPANSGTPAAGPSDFRSVTFKLTGLSGVEDLSWSVDANSAINSIIIYAASRAGSESDAAALSTDHYFVGAPINGPELYNTTGSIWNIWGTGATQHFAWSGNAFHTGTTYANLLDGALTGYASTAAGFWAIPEKQATLTATTTEVTLWCYASSTSTGGRVRFTTSAGTLATITGIGAAGYYSTTGTLSSAVTESQLVVVECSEATAGQTVTVSGAGMYSFTV